jgi:hypothetical protein
MGAAQRPVRKLQQPDVQAASLAQGPVMNWPWPATRRVTGGVVSKGVEGEGVVWCGVTYS